MRHGAGSACDVVSCLSVCLLATSLLPLPPTAQKGPVENGALLLFFAQNSCRLEVLGAHDVTESSERPGYFPLRPK